MSWRRIKAGIVQILVRAGSTLFFRPDSRRESTTLPANLEIGNGAQIAVLVPHPDDEVIATYHFIETFGEDHHIDLIYVTESVESATRCERFAESAAATAELRVRNTARWGFVDGSLRHDDPALLGKLQEIAESYAIFLAPCPVDVTPDHAELAMAASRLLPATKLLWYRSTWLTFTLDQADLVVTGSAARKRDALRSFRTQSGLALQNVVSFAEAEARRAGLPAASLEAFRLASSGAPRIKPLNSLSLGSLMRFYRWQ